MTEDLLLHFGGVYRNLKLKADKLDSLVRKVLPNSRLYFGIKYKVLRITDSLILQI